MIGSFSPSRCDEIKNSKNLFTAAPYWRTVAGAQPCFRMNKLVGSKDDEVDGLFFNKVNCAEVRTFNISTERSYREKYIYDVSSECRLKQKRDVESAGRYQK